MYKKVATLLFSLSLITASFMGNCQYLKQLVTAKFTPGGAVAWERYAGDNIGRTTVRGICTDVNSNVYITGKMTAGIWFGDTWLGGELFVVKYDSTGGLLWAKPIEGSFMFLRVPVYQIRSISSSKYPAPENLSMINRA